LSHIGVFNRIVADGLTSALVLEDDALIDQESLDLLARLRDLAVFESGFVHLGAQEGLEHLTRLAHGTPDRRLDGLWKVHPDDLSKIYRAVGYMVSRKDAIGLRELGMRGAYLADDWAYVMENNALDTFFICDCLGHPKDTVGSDIQLERKFMRSLIKKPNMALGARLMREFKSTIDSRREDSQRKRRLQGQNKIAWRSRWSEIS
jgi:GR25 family glycosyltransferase involved in LPS biosynthesis